MRMPLVLVIAMAITAPVSATPSGVCIGMTHEQVQAIKPCKLADESPYKSTCDGVTYAGLAKLTMQVEYIGKFVGSISLRGQLGSSRHDAVRAVRAAFAQLGKAYGKVQLIGVPGADADPVVALFDQVDSSAERLKGKFKASEVFVLGVEQKDGDRDANVDGRLSREDDGYAIEFRFRQVIPHKYRKCSTP